MICNLPIKIENIKLSENIFRPDVGALTAKTVRQKHAPVVSDFIEDTKELVSNLQDVIV